MLSKIYFFETFFFFFWIIFYFIFYVSGSNLDSLWKKVTRFIMKLNFFTSCLKTPGLFLGEPGFFISSCFRFLLFLFLLVFVSKDDFIVDCIYLCPLLLPCLCYYTSSWYLTPPIFIKAFLWPAVLSWRLQGFPKRFKTQTRPICLFEVEKSI